MQAEGWVESSVMKRVLFMLFLAALSMRMSAQIEYGATKYYPEGTRWTEICIDTAQYKSWFSKVGETWIPNYEMVEYYVKDEYLNEYDPGYGPFKLVYCHREGKQDSLCLALAEWHFVPSGCHSIMIGYPYLTENGKSMHLHHTAVKAYNFDYMMEVGERITYTQYMREWTRSYGTAIDKGEKTFGGNCPLVYLDVLCESYAYRFGEIVKDTICLINGIGFTWWRARECLFSGPGIYDELHESEDKAIYYRYRSMLVHFERDGEVLYDVWPQPGDMPDGIEVPLAPTPREGAAIYDLQGRKVEKPEKGIYIVNGRKVMIK